MPESSPGQYAEISAFSEAYAAPILRALATATDGGVLVLSQDGRIQQINQQACEFIGVQSGDVLGRCIDDIGFPALAELHRMAQGESSERLVVNVAIPSTGQMAEFRLKRVETDDGERAGTAMLIRPARTERQLDRLKSDFLSAVSHELRTPLTSILGYANLVADAGDAIEAEDRRQCLNTIERQGRVLLELIDDLIEMAKLDSDQLEFTLESCNADSLLEEVASELQLKASAAEIAVSVEAEPAMALECDSTRLRQAISHLVENAIKFSPPGASIRLSAFQQGACVVFQVVDTGYGIQPEHQSRVFDRFFQGHRLPAAGSGLGLAIVKRIVELHNGEVFMESQPDRGSTFGFSLPLQRLSHQAAA